MGEREREREGEERGVYLGSEGGVEVKLIEVIHSRNCGKVKSLDSSELTRYVSFHV